MLVEPTLGFGVWLMVALVGPLQVGIHGAGGIGYRGVGSRNGKDEDTGVKVCLLPQHWF